MTDGWERPTGDGERAPHDAIEIELVGPGGPPALGDDDAPPVPPSGHVPNWRKVVGLSSLAGVALGSVIAFVVVTADSDEAAPDTTPDTELPSPITTPPTLPPVVDEPDLDPGPTAPTSQTLDLFRDPTEQAIETSGLELPDFTNVLHDAAPGEYELDVDSITPGRGVRSTITIRQRDDIPVTVDAVFDTATGRMRMSVADDPEFGFVSDPVDGSLYNTIDGTNWQRGPAALIEQALGMSVAEYVDSIVVGPLRESTFAAATLSPTRFVTGDDGEIVREFAVVIPTDALPEWEVLYDSAAVFTDGGAVETARFVALVAADGTLRRIDGLNPTADGGAVLSSHRLEFDAEVAVELPPADTVSEMVVDQPGGDGIGGPDHRVLGESELDWSDFDAALAAFTAPDSVTIDEWYPDGTVTSRFERSADGRTRAFRQLTRPSPLAIIEQVTDTITGTTYARDEDNPHWRVVDGEPPLGVVDDSSFGLLVDADVLRSAGPSPVIALVLVDGDTVAHRASLVIEPGSHGGAASSIAGDTADRVVIADVLVSDDGTVIGMSLTPFDDDRSFAIEQRFDADEVVIELPVVGG